MINATFDELNRSAAVSGVYQYDTGQRLRMHGLPSPEEIAQADDFLSGDIATVQVHFGARGDSQTEARLARWDEERGCWETAVPDSCFLAAEDMYAYVYVSYGVDAEGNGRTKTMYELTFRPIARPAPNNVATNEQWEAWATKKSELEMALDALETAAASLDDVAAEAESAAAQANEAALEAQKAAEAAQEAEDKLDSATGFWLQDPIAVSLPSRSQATAAVENGRLVLGIPQGDAGAQGQTGDTGPADISLAYADGVLTITPM